MSNNPLISVIVPAYNEEKYIAACLKSLIRQKTKINYEIILVDNNSTDKTSEIAEKLGVRVVKEPRQGRAYARQKGAENANGGILAYTEADCIAVQSWVESIWQYFNDNPAVLGFVGTYRFYSSSTLLYNLTPHILYLSSQIYRLFYGNYTFRGTNFAIRKSAVEKVNGFNQSAVPFDDVDLGRRIGQLGSIHFLPDLFVETSDRRVRGRLFTFLKEFTTSYMRVFFLDRQGKDDWYKPIR